MTGSAFVLAIDQALKVSGYSTFSQEGLLLEWGKFAIDESLPIDARLVQFEDELSELYETHRFEHLVFEGIQYQNNAETFKKLAYVQSVIYIWCYKHGVAYTVLPPSVWRCELGGGFGKTRKEQKEKAIEYVRDRFGCDVSSDEADAICIGAAYTEMAKREEGAWSSP